MHSACCVFRGEKHPWRHRPWKIHSVCFLFESLSFPCYPHPPPTVTGREPFSITWVGKKKKKPRTKNKDPKVSYKAKRASAGRSWRSESRLPGRRPRSRAQGGGSGLQGQKQSRRLRRACCRQEWVFGVPVSRHCYNSQGHEVMSHGQINE